MNKSNCHKITKNSKKKKFTPAIQQKQKLFMQKLKETFWAVSKEYKKYLRTASQKSTNSKKNFRKTGNYCKILKFQVGLDQFGS